MACGVRRGGWLVVQLGARAAVHSFFLLLRSAQPNFVKNAVEEFWNLLYYYSTVTRGQHDHQAMLMRLLFLLVF